MYKINVSVSGEEDFEFDKINSILNEKGIKSGVMIKDIDIAEIQKLIISSQNNISSCTVKKNGGNLDIVIYPGVLKDEINKENIYSRFNAVITEVKVYSGKSSLKVCDLVKEGDLLIENNNGASGVIKGKVYFSDYILYNENQMVKEKTGREFIVENILIFKKILNKRQQNNKYTNYFEENCVFCVSKNAFIPVYLIETKYSEFEYKEKIVPFSEVENELKQKLYSDVLTKVPNEFNLTNVTYSVVSENNLTRLDCFVECEINLLA